MATLGRSLKQKALAVQNATLHEAVSRVDDALEHVDAGQSSAVAVTFEQAFFRDPNNRAELESRLNKSGYQARWEPRGGPLVVSTSTAKDVATPATSVTIRDVQPAEFQHAQPKKEHKLMPKTVVMGRHSSVSAPVAPFRDVVPPKDKGELTPSAPAPAAVAAAAVEPAPAAARPAVASAKSPRGAVNVPKISLTGSSTVEMADFLKLDPIKVREHYHPRSDAVSVRARANAKLSPSELKALHAGSVKCHLCKEGFDLFRSPDKCGECKRLVCTKCSTNLPYLEALLGQDSCVCSDCWRVTRVKLEVKAANADSTPSERALALAEVAAGDVTLNLDASERISPAEQLLVAHVLATRPELRGAALHTAALAEAKTRKCKCCDRGYDLFRRPTLCDNCKQVVCASAACVRVVTEHLHGTAASCCRNCWSDVRVALVDKQKHKPETFNAIEVDLAVGDRFLVEAKPGTAMHLESAFDEAIQRAEKTINEHRRAEHEPKMSVSRSPRVAIEPKAASKAPSVGVGLNAAPGPSISPRLDAVSPRAVASSKFSIEEARDIKSNKVVCRRCQRPFSLFRAPERCAECQYTVCTACCYALPHLNELLGQDGTTCLPCWDLVRTRLLGRGRALPALAARCDREVAIGDRELFKEDRTTQAERLLRARSREDAQKHPSLFRRTEDEHLERFVAKLNCAVCRRHFDLFRRPSMCKRCKEIVCCGAACLRTVAWNESECCRNCWPELRGELQRSSEAITDKSEYETIAADMAFGDHFLHDLHFGDKINVVEATEFALRTAQALVARRRLDLHQDLTNSAFVSPDLHTSSEVRLLAGTVPEPELAVSERVMAFDKFSPADREQLDKGKLRCARCADRFSVFKAPDRCGQCSAAVCSKCSFVFPRLHHCLPSVKSSCVCSKCWDELRYELKRIDTPVSLGQLALGDEVLFTEPEDRDAPAEVALERQRKETGRRDVTLEEFTASLTCRKCAQHFGLWNNPTLCMHCNLVVCMGPTCSKYVASLKNAPVTCCDCWPSVRRELLAVAAQQPELADEVDMERAIGDKLFLANKPGPKSDLRRLLHEAEKEGRNMIAQRNLGLSQTNILAGTKPNSDNK